ncbi:tungstate ABC transporter substrate-binding protein WtpA [Archaeoglobales archaeon]|nr:MAG: tungstate ABC transporter substrate-binding protein WtpA [Archaeoglobales archaeon]
MRAGIIILLCVLLIGCVENTVERQEEAILTIFNAGSLTVPLEEVNKEFKEYVGDRYDVNIKTEASGSVKAVRKITDLEMKADILAVADYTLLPKFVYPKYADFYVLFATNELVLCYTNSSKHADEVNSNNWYEILARDEVRFGFSNPNIDPCGYRTVMAMKLADLTYNKSIFERLIVNHTNIKSEGNRIITPKVVEGDGKVVIRDKSVDLLALLESNSIDYAFEYKSVALQHGLKFVELPDEINLKNFGLKDWYAQTSITVWKKENEKIVQKEIKAMPIIYGVTVLKDAPNKKVALEYLRFLLNEKGREIFAKNHQEFLKTPIGYGNIPSEIKGLVRSP